MKGEQFQSGYSQLSDLSIFRKQGPSFRKPGLSYIKKKGAPCFLLQDCPGVWGRFSRQTQKGRVDSGMSRPESDWYLQLGKEGSPFGVKGTRAWGRHHSDRSWKAGRKEREIYHQYRAGLGVAAGRNGPDLNETLRLAKSTGSVPVNGLGQWLWCML